MHAPITAAEVAPSDAAWWTDHNSRIDGHVAAQAKHEAEISRLLDNMAARHAEETAFLQRWDAMTYPEALAFQRAGGVTQEAVDV